MRWPLQPGYGLECKELTAERLKDIIAIYDTVTGTAVASRWKPEVRFADCKAALEASSQWELRLGYPGNRHGKIKATLLPYDRLKIELDTNDDDRNEFPEGSVNLMETFRYRLKEYLDKQGILVLLP